MFPAHHPPPASSLEKRERTQQGHLMDADGPEVSPPDAVWGHRSLAFSLPEPMPLGVSGR